MDKEIYLAFIGLLSTIAGGCFVYLKAQKYTADKLEIIKPLREAFESSLAMKDEDLKVFKQREIEYKSNEAEFHEKERKYVARIVELESNR